MHGLTIAKITRWPIDRFGQRFDQAQVPTREKAFGVGRINTEGFTGDVDFEMTPDEVKELNTLEAKIATRLSRETARKGNE
jgi:hypothetical protein